MTTANNGSLVVIRPAVGTAEPKEVRHGTRVTDVNVTKSRFVRNQRLQFSKPILSAPGCSQWRGAREPTARRFFLRRQYCRRVAGRRAVPLETGYRAVFLSPKWLSKTDY